MTTFLTVSVCGPYSRIPGETDSTIAPPKPAIFFNERLLDTRKYTGERKVSTWYFVCKGLSIDDVGASMDDVSQEIRPEAGFETGDFVGEKLGGLP